MKYISFSCNSWCYVAQKLEILLNSFFYLAANEFKVILLLKTSWTICSMYNWSNYFCTCGRMCWWCIMVCVTRECFGINPSHPFLNSSLLEELLIQLFFQRARIVKACHVAEDKLKKIFQFLSIHITAQINPALFGHYSCLCYLLSKFTWTMKPLLFERFLVACYWW